MYRSPCAAAVCLLTASLAALATHAVAQEGWASRIDEGDALPTLEDGIPRFREDSGWNNGNYDAPRWGVEYGTSLRSTPWSVVLQSDRTNASFAARANQLTLDLAGHTYSLEPYLDGKAVQGGKLIISDGSGTSSGYLKIVNGVFSNAFVSGTMTTVGEANGFGRLVIENADLVTSLANVGVASGSTGLAQLNDGGSMNVHRELSVGILGNGSLELQGQNSKLTAGEITIGGSSGHGTIVLRDPTALLAIHNTNTSGNLTIKNKTASGLTPGLRVMAGTVSISQHLDLGNLGRSGVVSIEGGTVQVGAKVYVRPATTATDGGRIFFHDGRLAVVDPGALSIAAPSQFSWKSGTLAFTGPNVVVTDVNLRQYTTQGAIDYGGTRAAGAIADTQTIEAAGTMTLTGGTARINGGTLRAGTALVVEAPLEGHGTLDAVVTGSGSITNATTSALHAGALGGSNVIHSDGNLIVGHKNVDATFSGSSDGAGTFTKVGTGTQTVTGLVANAGGIDVRAGSLEFTGSGERLATGDVSIDAGATLRMTQGATGSATSVTLAGSDTLPARLEIEGTTTRLDVSDSLVNYGWIDLAGGTLEVGGAFVNHGRLINDGTLVASVSGSGILGGSGLYSGPVTIGGGSTLAPGNSPGTSTFSDLTLAPGGTFELELAAATGIAGIDWDLTVVTDLLTIAATAADPFTIALKSLDGSLQAGVLADFDATQAYSWLFLDTTLANPAMFDLTAFQLDTTGFQNDLAGGSFSLAANTSGLAVVYSPQVTSAPEPTSSLLLAAAGTIGGLIHWRRRRHQRRELAA